MQHLIYFLVINMDKNQKRWNNIVELFKKYNIKNYERIEGIDPQNLKYKEVINKLLYRERLLGRELSCNNNYENTKWMYDGTFNTSWPNLSYGTKSIAEKGLILSNLVALERSKSINSKFICILEDDIFFSLENYKRLYKYLKTTNKELIILDNRQNKMLTGCGTSGVIYSKNIIDKIYNYTHPLSTLKITYNLWQISELDKCVLDFFMMSLLRKIKHNIRWSVIPIIVSDLYPSTIQLKKYNKPIINLNI